MDAVPANDSLANSAPTPDRTAIIRLAGNVTTQPFARIVGRLRAVCDAELVHHDFGQPIQALLAPDAADFLIVHLDHRWFFKIAPDHQSVERMNELIAAVKGRVARGDCTVILNTIPSAVDAPVRTEQAALRGAVARLNAQLYELAASLSHPPWSSAPSHLAGFVHARLA